MLDWLLAWLLVSLGVVWLLLWCFWIVLFYLCFLDEHICFIVVWTRLFDLLVGLLGCFLCWVDARCEFRLGCLHLVALCWVLFILIWVFFVWLILVAFYCVEVGFMSDCGGVWLGCFALVVSSLTVLVYLCWLVGCV